MPWELVTEAIESESTNSRSQGISNSFRLGTEYRLAIKVFNLRQTRVRFPLVCVDGIPRSASIIVRVFDLFPLNRRKKKLFDRESCSQPFPISEGKVMSGDLNRSQLRAADQSRQSIESHLHKNDDMNHE